MYDKGGKSIGSELDEDNPLSSTVKDNGNTSEIINVERDLLSPTSQDDLLDIEDGERSAETPVSDISMSENQLVAINRLSDIKAAKLEEEKKI